MLRSKAILCVLVCLAVSTTGSRADVVVHNHAEFAYAVAHKEPVIILGDSFVATSTVVIVHDCSIVAGQDVTIDLAGHYVGVYSNSFALGGSEYTISFTSGAPNMLFSSAARELQGSITNCRFDLSAADNGVTMLCGGNDLHLTFSNCTANENVDDGFNLHNVGPTPGIAHVTLLDCIAMDNDRLGSGAPAGDGVTAHASNHTIELVGGYYANNGKGGATLVHGSNLVVDGAVFENNGWVTFIRDVHVTGTGGSLTWHSGYTATLELSNIAHMYGGEIGDVYLSDPLAEFNVHGFGFRDAVVAFDSCWQELSANAPTYVPQAIPMPGDTDGDRALTWSDAESFLLLPEDMCCDGGLILQDLALLQQHFNTPF